MDEPSDNGRDPRPPHPIRLAVTLLTLSWASFLALDQLPWFMMMEVGFNPAFIPILITVRASFADRLTALSSDFLELGQLKPDWRSFTLAALLFGAPLFTISFILGSTPSLLSPFVSLAWFTIRGGLIYEFPRLLLFVLLKNRLFQA